MVIDSKAGSNGGSAESERVLVVIDMQEGFDESGWSRVLKAVRQQLRLARRHGWPVIIVEMWGMGRTRWQLMRQLRVWLWDRHRPFVVVEKRTTDATARIEEVCRNHRFATAAFRVCGVKTHACVADTVDGLADAFPGCLIEVVTEGCAHWGGNQWEKFPSRPGVVLLEDS